MENPVESRVTTTVPVIENKKQNNLGIIIAVAVVCGMLGFIAGRMSKQTSTVAKNDDSKSKIAMATSTPIPTLVASISATKTASPTATLVPTITLVATVTVTPTINLKSYTSSFEKLTFQYPTDWTVDTKAQGSNVANADSLTIKSPSGKAEVVWVSALDGLGGGCDENVPLGTGAGCSLFEVVDKQKLEKANLYYVAYVETDDGVNYTPEFALEDDKGILITKRTMGYLLFKGKNNGGMLAGMSGNVIDATITKRTRAEAVKFFATAEALTAKKILLSASY